MAASPPTGTRNDVLLTSDSLFVQQNHRNPHENEAQRQQSIIQGSRSPTEPFPANLPSNQQPDKPPLAKETSSFSKFTSSLLSRPVFKALELKQGFEYGPPVPIAPDQFTRRLCSPAPINQHAPQQEPSNHTKLPTSATTTLSPKGPWTVPQPSDNQTNQNMAPPPPRAHAERGLLPPQPIPNDTGSLRLPVKRKNDHVQSMAPPPPRAPRAETRRQVAAVDHRPAPMLPQLDEPSDCPTGPLEIPVGLSTGQHESQLGLSRGGQERTRSHGRQSLHEAQDTSYERSKNSGQPDRRHPRGHVNPELASPESNKRQRQNPNPHISAEPPTEPHHHTTRPQIPTTRGQRNDHIPLREDSLVHQNPNMSKRRSPNHVSHHVPVSGLASSDLSEALTSSPAIQATRNTHEFSTSMTRAINHFNINQKSELERQKSHYKRKLRAFQRKVEKQAEALERLDKRLLDQLKDHQAVQETNNTLKDRNRELESQLELKDAELQSLTVSFDEYQDQSAKASDEKQRILDQLEKRNGELTKEVQAIKSSLKLARDEAEKWEAHAQDAERRVKIEEISKEDAYIQLDSIKLELSDLEHTLELEKAKSAALEEKFEDFKTAAKTTETLSTQYDEVIRRLEESNTQIKLEHQKCHEGSSSKLDTITEPLKRLAETLSAHSNTLANIESHCVSEPEFRGINSKLEAIIQYQNSHANEPISPLSNEIQESLRKFQKQLDDREELLRQQLEKKTNENNMLSALSRERDTEYQYRRAELEAERERSSRLEAELQDLQETLALIDATQDQAAETEIHLEAAKNEIVRLREEMEARESQNKELKNELEERSKASQAATQEFSAQVLKWNQKLQEKEETHKLAISRVEEVARREVRIDMEREIEKAKKLQHQTQQERDALSEQLEKLNENIARNEESQRKDATAIASLRKAITDLENRYERVSQEKTAQESLFEQAKAQDSEKLEALNAEVETMKAAVAESQQQTNSQITKSQRFLAALRQLAEQQGLSSSIVDNLEGLFEGKVTSNDINPRIAQAFDQFIGPQISRTMVDGGSSQPPSPLERGLQFCPNLISLLSKFRLADDLQSQRYPHGVSNSTVNRDPLINGAGNGGFPVNHAARLLSEERRVVVRSPVDFQLEPSPPTINQEKTRRRQGPQPKSIMKPITRSMANQFWSPVVPDPESLLRNGQHEDLDMYELPNVPTSAQHRNSPLFNRPPSNTRANENSGSQNPGSKSRKKSSEASTSTSTAPSTTRRKRGKKGDQKDPHSVTAQDSATQDPIPGARFKENVSNPSSYVNKSKIFFQPRGGDIKGDEIVDDDDDDRLLPQRILRSNKHPSHTTSGAPGEGEDATGRPPKFRPSFQKAHGSPKSMAPMQGSQLETQEDGQSSYWPPKTGTQDNANFLTGGGQSQADPFRFSPDLL